MLAISLTGRLGALSDCLPKASVHPSGKKKKKKHVNSMMEASLRSKILYIL